MVDLSPAHDSTREEVEGVDWKAAFVLSLLVSLGWVTWGWLSLLLPISSVV